MLWNDNELKKYIEDRKVISIKEVKDVKRASNDNDKYIVKFTDGSSAVIEGHSDSVGWYSYEEGDRIVLECGRNNPTYITGLDEEFDELRKFVDKLEVYESLKMVSVQRWRRSMLFAVVPVDVNIKNEREYNIAERSGNVLLATMDDYYGRNFLARYGDFEFKMSPEGATIITPELFETFKYHEYPYFLDEPVYKIGDRLIYESYTCLSGFAGTCRCINHPRKEWRDVKTNKKVFVI